MTVRQDTAWAGTSGKIAAHHRDRLAVVYVRQSTLRQVAQNTESAKLQYALAERAGELGWPPSRVLVIDEDMGHSAGGAQQRPGFTRLVSEVGLGHVGVVLGIEPGSSWCCRSLRPDLTGVVILLCGRPES